MKRKHDAPVNGKSKKRAISDDEAHQNFRDGLFDSKVLQDYTDYYAASQPYQHAVIQNLVDDSLLRNVRNEIREHIHFTPKETDIYKIHQSGDLANLDGLDDSALRRLPSLLKLRDSLYSSAFRKYLSSITGSGPLSGMKTDMAVNVYTPGCHLLCHDDVIGSRRVSWILYLLDPDCPWKPEWGGALRLYPTKTLQTAAGDKVKVPEPDFSVSIPPAWNQLSFFTVQPGESFHDVEEVYKKGLEEMDRDDGGRVRMAISGWFHIPQEGEEGYEEGLEEKLAERSSLAQLQGGKADVLDQPQQHWVDVPRWDNIEDQADEEFTADELDFLIKYMNPNYLTPDTVEEIAGMFSDDASLRLAEFLSPKFSQRLREYIESKDHEETPSLPANPFHKESKVGVARPPHKHRYLYREAVQPIPTPYPEKDGMTPYDDLVDILFPHPAFTKWITLVTGITLTKSNIYARRFRRGMDYTLATAYEGEDPQLEVCLGITPSKGWGDEEEEADDTTNGATKSNGKATARQQPDDEVGGYEMYMDGDDDEDGSDAGHPEIPTHTGAGQRRKAKADPAVYKSAGDEEDDGVLFSQPATWNHMAINLRDRGVLRFTKYVSKAAKGDRWDVCADYSVELGEDEDDEDDE
ncbi:Oxoglutarate and iron-dependent oxygenase degradation C-term-domain-containing protein [Lophiotrema nucula]|uniref:uS12 prolyl 3,4-dihydroxylase n=1 Tax=Lophiotrema nucula TaxID=690887 RepID=A0A6A5YRW1_9PLEO|nr:Oxoglutarate and iron-dependent oxygenase degradation C-term-domain-containing protein [Lophiotrema nucula]